MAVEERHPDLATAGVAALGGVALAGYAAVSLGGASTPLRVAIGVLVVAAEVGGTIWWWRGRSHQVIGMVSGKQIARAVKKAKHGILATYAHDGRYGIPALVEDAAVMVAPPRAGKTSRYVVGGVVDADGPVVVTSTKVDVLRLTQGLRRAKGRIHVFDPSGISSWPDTIGWDLVQGCEDPEVAVARATAMVAAQPLGQATNIGVFEKTSGIVLRCLLHAAAVKPGGDMRDVRRWASDFQDEEPLHLLRTSPRAAGEWHLDLAQNTRAASPETVASTQITLGIILEPLKTDRVMETVCPATGGFDVDAFLRSSDTLYLLSESDSYSPTAPITTAFVADIERSTRALSQRTDSTRPSRAIVTFILDEAANVAPLPNLPQLMTEAGGRGIHIRVIVQSQSQMMQRWGEHGGKTLFDAAAIKLVLGGSADVPFLESLSKLCGSKEVQRQSHQSTGFGNGQSTSTSVEKVPVIEPNEISQLRRGHALLLYREVGPARVYLPAWWERKDRKRFDESFQDALEREAGASRSAKTEVVHG